MSAIEANGNGAKHPIKVPVMHHVNLKTIRLQEMIDWYSNVVGCKVMFQNADIAFISNDAANHRIALVYSPLFTDDPGRRAHTGIHHTAFEYASVDDLLQTWLRLKDEQTLPHMALDHGFTLSFYYVDPDGNSVELQADWFGDWAESGKYLNTSQEFARNPIGVFVDPAGLLAARESGKSIPELHRMGYAGEVPPTTPPDLRFDIPQP
jgi:catechol 2,3-dioxygenase-like lactoylglutathione lyase family enzyme